MLLHNTLHIDGGIKVVLSSAADLLALTERLTQMGIGWAFKDLFNQRVPLPAVAVDQPVNDVFIQDVLGQLRLRPTAAPGLLDTNLVYAGS